MRVIGAAGHVDHGKSTLVKALTGIDPDRLKEEQQRAMTIDLGFAWLTLPSGEAVGIVDVPGHQDFIKNMLAGVGGIDATLFVVAADEGVKPQTREHLAILDLLEIPCGVIVLTKIDAVEDQDWLELVQADIVETVAGTVLANAPLVPVSALRGAGLDNLVKTLDQVLAQIPPRPNRGRPRLPIDRVFSMSGFGTVVTGVLLDGQLQVGQEVEILPQNLKSRIRGLQSHKKEINVAHPGSRAAVNLTGLSTQEIQRGNVLTTPGWLEPSQLLDVQLRLLHDAPRPLRHNQEVEVFTGATEVIGYTRLLGAGQLEPGQTGWAQLRLVRRIPVVKGDRFIIRQPSPSLTIGGGVVVDPLPRRRHRRFQPDLLKRLDTLLAGAPEDILLGELDRRGPISIQTLLAECRLTTQVAAPALENLLRRGDAFFLINTEMTGRDVANNAFTGTQNPLQKEYNVLSAAKSLVASPGGWATLLGQIQTTLQEYHTRFPLRAGMPRNELKSRLKLEIRLFNEAIQRGQEEGILAATDTMARLAAHQVKFSQAQQTAVDRLLAEFRRAPYNTPLPKDMAAAIGEEVLLALIEGGQLIRLSPEVILLAETYQEFIVWLKKYLQGGKTVNVAQVRDVFQTSRKYALALLEHTDEQRLTRRVGDERVLREVGR